MTTETKPAYSPGLAGVIAGETQICWVDPNAGLAYRGYDIHEMGEKATFEEVAYLLLNGELPSVKQLKDFARAIGSERQIPQPVTQMLGLLPKGTHPMDMVRTGVSMLGPFDKELNGWLKIVLGESDEAIGHRAPPFGVRTNRTVRSPVPLNAQEPRKCRFCAEVLS